MIDRLNDIPHAEELDFYVYRKSSLELLAQVEALLIFSRVHGIRERQLFNVAWREKTNFLKHASESTCCKGSTRETENGYLIPDMI